MIFRDRIEAGKLLAAELEKFAGRRDVVVLALPRGGVPVACEVANAIAAPLDVFLVRKLGVPGHEELAMGAIASGGIRVLNEDVIGPLRIKRETIDAVTRREHAELVRREHAYRGERRPPDVGDMIVILVDDGLATGSTMRAAVAALRRQKPEKIVVAVPVAAPEVCVGLRGEADDVVCAVTPRPFFGVGCWYRDFSQTTDDEVRELLRRSSSVRKSASG